MKPAMLNIQCVAIAGDDEDETGRDRQNKGNVFTFIHYSYDNQHCVNDQYTHKHTHHSGTQDSCHFCIS